MKNSYFGPNLNKHNPKKHIEKEELRFSPRGPPGFGPNCQETSHFCLLWFAFSLDNFRIEPKKRNPTVQHILIVKPSHIDVWLKGTKP